MVAACLVSPHLWHDDIGKSCTPLYGRSTLKDNSPVGSDAKELVIFGWIREYDLEDASKR